jgi:hypothetical protein
MPEPANHTPRKTYRLPRPIVDGLDEAVRRGLAANQTGAVIAASVAWLQAHGIEMAPPKKSRRKSAGTT